MLLIRRCRYCRDCRDCRVVGIIIYLDIRLQLQKVKRIEFETRSQVDDKMRHHRILIILYVCINY